MSDKLRTLAEAGTLISDGDQIVMGAGMERSPMALLREIVRQGRKRLRLAGVVGGAINLDFLVGAGSAASVDTCSVTLGRFARTGPNFQRHVQQGRIRALDNTWGVLYAMIQAGSMGIPYLPVLGLAGSDLPGRREDMILHPDPFGGGFETIVVKAMRPDVALFHALKADRAGNIFFGYQNDNVILAEASKIVVVSVESVVEALTPEERAVTFMPGILVDAVVEARFGAHPSACPGAYPVDETHMALYASRATSDESFAGYLEDTVFKPGDHGNYVKRFVPDGWGLEGEKILREAGD